MESPLERRRNGYLKKEEIKGRIMCDYEYYFEH